MLFLFVSWFHGSNYNYQFIIKELANEFEGKIECLGENKKYYKNFSLPIEKEVREINKNGNESVVTISYKIKFIDGARFMATPLSNLLENLSEGIHKIECRVCDCFRKYESLKDTFIKFKFLSCNKN